MAGLLSKDFVLNFIKTKKIKIKSPKLDLGIDSNIQNINKKDLSCKSWIELSRDNFNFNISTIKNLILDQKIFVVLKSNAYGHGLKEIGYFCDQNEQVAGACVFSLSEALFLRSNNFKKDILVLALIDAAIEDAILNNITLTVFNLDLAYQIHNLAKKLSIDVKVHIKIDTGLSRLGFLAQDLKNTIESIKIISELNFIKIDGIFSHFAESDSQDDVFTLKQLENFRLVLKALELEGIFIPNRHISNSSSVLRHGSKFYDFNMVRIGGSSLGLIKPKVKEVLGFDLRFVLTWKCKSVQIKNIPKDSFVSYERTYQVKKDTKIAILPVGYYDGLPRALSNKGFFQVNGKMVPILGRIGMNMTIVDVSEVKNLDSESIFTVISPLKGVTPDDISSKSAMLTYEVMTGLSQSIFKMVV